VPASDVGQPVLLKRCEADGVLVEFEAGRDPDQQRRLSLGSGRREIEGQPAIGEVQALDTGARLGFPDPRLFFKSLLSLVTPLLGRNGL